MSGPLNSIFAAVNSQITANLASRGITPTYGTVGSDRFAEGAPPRITWVPGDAQYDAPRGQGGDFTVDSAGNYDIVGNPPLLTRIQSVDVDIWGADRDSVELLHDAVISALYDCISDVSTSMVNGQWLEREATGKDGEMFRMTVQFKIPVIRFTPNTTTAVIASIPETPQVNH